MVFCFFFPQGSFVIGVYRVKLFRLMVLCVYIQEQSQNIGSLSHIELVMILRDTTWIGSSVVFA